jgi:hypothetical protein
MHNNHLTFYDCTTIIEFGRDVDCVTIGCFGVVVVVVEEKNIF